MGKTIGIILLIYGVAGVTGAFIAYGALRGPIQQLRELLKQLSQQLNQGAGNAKQASDWLAKGSPILEKVAELISLMVGFIRAVSKFVGDAANTMKGVETTLDSVKVPVLAFQTRTLDLSLGNVTVITGIHLEKHNIAGIKVYGPPLETDTANIGLNLGKVPVITGVTMTTVNPLQPAGDVFRFVAEKVQGAGQQIDQLGDRVEEAKERTLEAKENLDKTADRLNKFAEQLDDAGKNALEISKSKLLSLAPALFLGYFGLIHLAFALTGLALLTMN